MRLTPPGALLSVFALLFVAPAPARADWVPSGVRLCGAPGIQRNPYVAFDGHGAIVTWEDQRGGVGTSGVYAARVLPSGVLDSDWTVDGNQVATSTGNQQDPQIVPDGAGGCFIAWDDSRAGNLDVYVQRLQADGRPATGWPLEGLAVSAAVGNQSVPTLCSDGSGGALIAWIDERTGSGNSDVYATHVLASGAIASGWPTNGRAVCDTANIQILQSIVSDAQGGAIVSWVDRRSGTEYDLYANRLTGAGAIATGWPRQGAVVTAAALDQTTPVSVSDGAGGLFVVWNDFRNGEGDVYAQHLGALGAPVAGWAANGNALCSATGSQFGPQASSDQQGGLLAVWEDYRGDGDIYGTRVSANGQRAAGWVADGNAICSAVDMQYSPWVLGDGSGGAFFAWEDERNVGFNVDVWAQHLGPDAAPAIGWAVDGSALCTAGGYQFYPVFATDGAAGAYVTWQDRRNLSHFDIYVSRVGPELAVVADVATNDARRPGLAVVGANPFQSRTAVRLTLPRAGAARVQVIDPSGRLVRTLSDGAFAAGTHEFPWDGRDEQGRATAPGIYLVRAVGEGIAARTKLVRLN